MEKIEKIQLELKTILSEKRYNHCVGVSKMAKELAKQYGINEEIAELTGIVHDIAKEMPEDEKLQYVKENNIEIDEIERHNISLLHSKIGADIAKNKYGFTKEMQNAIKYHTTAHTNMDLLAKIIFVADKIDETRTYDEVEDLRKLAKKNIDECVIQIINYWVKSNIDKGMLIHPDSINARNELVTNLHN